MKWCRGMICCSKWPPSAPISWPWKKKIRSQRSYSKDQQSKRRMARFRGSGWQTIHYFATCKQTSKAKKRISWWFTSLTLRNLKRSSHSQRVKHLFNSLIRLRNVTAHALRCLSMMIVVVNSWSYRPTGTRSPVKRRNFQMMLFGTLTQTKSR